MYNANYMDGVPVKIAEKYKPPPAVYKLPQSLANKLNLDDNYYRNSPAFVYDLQLERKALSKIDQWKHIRQRNKELRKERISRREEQRKREAEDRQKNLLYSVSYPSTDDLSSGEEEENAEENGKESLQSKETAPKICVTETVNSFHNILQPTVLSYNSSSGNSNSTLTPLIKSTFESSKLSNSFNYKDFEDDTSSPFDNIELKTINDLDVLAQVLHNTQIKSPAPVDVVSDNTALSTSDTNTNDTSNSQCYPEQQQITQFLHNDSRKIVENIPPKRNINLPRFNYDLNSTQGALTELRDHHTIAMSTMQYNANLPLTPPTATPPQHQYNGQANSTNDYYNYQANSHFNQNSDNPQPYNRIQALTEDHATKSRSVPDILKELSDEVRNSEIRRYRNCSYNTETSTQNNDACLTNEEPTTKKMINVKDSETEEILSKLDSKAKQLVEQISAMGFPLKRVARIVQLVGTDDKKVIEHLIPLSELVDLGFEEGKISDALIRNENNKNKALDDLVS